MEAIDTHKAMFEETRGERRSENDEPVIISLRGSEGVIDVSYVASKDNVKNVTFQLVSALGKKK